MHQPRKWWIGLPILAALTYFATTTLTPQIEADLAARLAARLSAATDAAEKPQIGVSGRDVTVSGLGGHARKAQTLAALGLEPGLRRLVDATAAALDKTPDLRSFVAPPPAEPYVFTAAIGEGVVALSGRLPTQETRRQVVAQAAAIGAGLAVSDATQLSDAAPKGDYAAALGFALRALGRLSQGKVTLADASLSIEGQGRENVRAETIETEAKTRLPQGFALVRADVAAGPVSPYVFTATREGGAAILTGYAPDEGARKRIVEAARRRFFDATLTDRLAVAKGAPPHFLDAVEASLTALARLAEGGLSISGANVSLSGAARYEAARAGIERALADSLPRGFASDARLVTRTVGSALEAAPCRAALAELSTTPIRFEADDATIADESAPVLDALATTVLRCQGVVIEVGAHTDNLGIEELNRDRSRRRARAVVERLVAAGADPVAVTPVGYGGERPLAPNDSEENRARNRRIEFVVK